MKIYHVIAVVLFPVLLYAGSGDLTSPTSNYDEGDWANTTNIYSSNDSRSSNTGTNQHRVGGNGFGFSITDGATIDSIVVTVEGQGAGTTTARRTVKINLSKDGGATSVGDTVTAILKLEVDSTMTIRGTTNGLWGTTWSESEIESSNFTVTVRKATATGATALQDLDYIGVRVYWSGGSPPSSDVLSGQLYNANNTGNRYRDRRQ